MTGIPPTAQVALGAARALVGGAPTNAGGRLCPICGNPLRPRQRVCSGRCRAELSRRRQAQLRHARDQQIREVLVAALALMGKDGDRAVRRPQGLDGAARRPGSRGGTQAPRPGSRKTFSVPCTAVWPHHRVRVTELPHPACPPGVRIADHMCVEKVRYLLVCRQRAAEDQFPRDEIRQGSRRTRRMA